MNGPENSYRCREQYPTRLYKRQNFKLTWSSFTSTFWLLLVQWWFVSGQIVFRGGLFCLASLVVIEWSILLLNVAVSRTYQNSSKRSNRNIPSLFWIILNEKKLDKYSNIKGRVQIFGKHDKIMVENVLNWSSNIIFDMKSSDRYSTQK